MDVAQKGQHEGSLCQCQHPGCATLLQDVIIGRIRDLFVLFLTTAHNSTTISKLNNEEKTKLPNNRNYRKISDHSQATDSKSNRFIGKQEEKGSNINRKGEITFNR